MPDLQTAYSKCKKNILCQECEHRVDEAIRFEGLTQNMIEMGYKCNKHNVYSTSSTLKDHVLLDNIIHGELAEQHIKTAYKYPELLIKAIKEGNIEIEWRY